MSRKSLTPDERHARLDAAHARLTSAVRSFQSSDDWVAYLRVASRFTRYSLGNTLLIYAQRPDASHVAGYRKWQSLGRQVCKGATGIAIFAPVTRKAEREVPDTGESETYKMFVGYRIEHVFAYEDTEGEELPRVGRPILLAGEAPEGMREELERQIANTGCRLQLVDEIALHPGANGLTNYTTRTVQLATAGRDDASQARTLAHDPFTAPARGIHPFSFPR